MTDASTTAYSVLSLPGLDDDAPAGGLGDAMEARFAGRALGCETIGLSLQRVPPEGHVPFAHRHAHDEEVYVVVGGSGRALVDGDTVELRPMTALRVAPAAARSFAAGADGLEFLAFGAHTAGDGEILPDPWTG
jgi:uncharacterized cupin superfamily protein